MQADTKKQALHLDIEFKEFAQVRKENLETGKFDLAQFINPGCNK